MNKIKKHVLSVLSLLVVVAFVSSCDNEAVDKVLEDGALVGKPVIEVSKDGESRLIRSGFSATLNKRSEFTLHMPSLFEEKDQLNIFTLLFVEGSFPGNANASRYFAPAQNQWYSSVNPLRPEFVTGIVELISINKVARVIQGKFDLRMTPISEEGNNSSSVATALNFRGNFVDVPYSREEPFYLEAQVDASVFRNTTTSAVLEHKTLTMVSTSDDSPEQKLTLIVPVDGLNTGDSITLEYDQYQVEYSSEFGVVYKYNAADPNNQKSQKVVVVCEDSEKGIYKGSFSFVLNDTHQDSQKSISISYGDFRVEAQ